MGNPHPTKSKPCKIGRKHTGAPSEKTKQKRKNGALIEQKRANEKRRKISYMLHLYFTGELELIPAQARFKIKTPPTYKGAQCST